MAFLSRTIVLLSQSTYTEICTFNETFAASFHPRSHYPHFHHVSRAGTYVGERELAWCRGCTWVTPRHGAVALVWIKAPRCRPSPPQLHRVRMAADGLEMMREGRRLRASDELLITHLSNVDRQKLQVGSCLAAWCLSSAGARLGPE